jgi:sensor histidine kinase regulating citrate/malate metabolism
MTTEAASYLELLRRQRHDFINHLQVIYSLLQVRRLEMALDYIYRVGAEMQERGALLRLKSPALVLTLLTGELEAERRGVPVRFEVGTDLADLEVSEEQLGALVGLVWERVMGALEAASGSEAGLTVYVEEQKEGFRIRWELLGYRSESPAAEAALGGTRERAREIGARLEWHAEADSLTVDLAFGR